MRPRAGGLLHDAAAMPHHAHRIGAGSARRPRAARRSRRRCGRRRRRARKPHDFHSAASATCSANSAGCATSVCAEARARLVGAASSSSSDQPASGRSSASHRVERVAEHRLAGEQLAAHAEPLRALAAEDERRRAARRRPRRDVTGGVARRSDTRCSRARQSSLPRADHREAAVVVRCAAAPAV